MPRVAGTFESENAMHASTGNGNDKHAGIFAEVLGCTRRYHVSLTAAALLIGCAALLRCWIAPALQMLPDRFEVETIYRATLQSHQRPDSEAEVTHSTVKRVEQALAAQDGHVIVQGDMHWLTDSGSVIFETFGRYGIDRRSKRNVRGIGDQDRNGQYWFPTHVEKKQYDLWDPVYAGPADVSFDHAVNFRGLEIYVFTYRVKGLDETSGYASLPDVPERYNAITYGEGSLWIEPLSGIVLDHEDSGISYFVDPKSGQNIGKPVNQWIARYTPETVDAQVLRAVAARHWILALELWLPLVLSAAGVALAALGWLSRARP